MTTKTTTPTDAAFIPPPPVDPYAHLYVDELPTQARAGRGHVENEYDRHIAALLASGRSGLRVVKDNDGAGQRRRYQAAAKLVGKTAWLIDADGEHVIVTVRDKIAKGVRVG